MNKKAVVNNTNGSASVGAVVTLALGNMLAYYLPELVAVVGEVNTGILLGWFVTVGSRQLWYLFVERKRDKA